MERLIKAACCACAAIAAHANADLGDELEKLVGHNAYDKFGTSVAIDGDIAVIGAPGVDFNNQNNYGSAYVVDVTTGATVHTLTGSHVGPGDAFGWSVAVDADIAVVGAYGSFAHEDPGEAYVFDVSTGQQLQRLMPLDGNKYDQFGWTVDVSGDIAVIGARYDSDAEHHAGSAYLFNIDTGQQIAKLTHPSPGRIMSSATAWPSAATWRSSRASATMRAISMRGPCSCTTPPLASRSPRSRGRNGNRRSGSRWRSMLTSR